MLLCDLSYDEIKDLILNEKPVVVLSDYQGNNCGNKEAVVLAQSPSSNGAVRVKFINGDTVNSTWSMPKKIVSTEPISISFLEL